MLKKLAAGVFAAAMIFATTGIISEDFFGQQVAITASAEEGVWGYYHYYSDGEKVWITYYTGDGGDVVIPSEIHGIPVEIIDAFAFMDNESLTSVTIPSSVRIISMSAFDNCVNLEEVYLSEGVETLNISAFGGCPNLRKVVLPRSVSSIGEYVFFNSDDLVIYCYEASYAHQYAIENEISYVLLDKEAEEPDTNIDFEYEILEDGTIVLTGYTGNASELTIPSEIDGKKVTAIGELFFNFYSGGNNTVKKLTVPGSVKTIGEAAFAGGYALEEVIIEDGVEVIGGAAFGSCTSLKKITIPASVNEIGNSVFCWAYASDSPAVIGVTIYCYKDSVAHKYAMGENITGALFEYVLLDEEDETGIDTDNSSETVDNLTNNSIINDSTNNTNKSNDFPKTGTTAGLAFAGIALAGMAVIVSKKNK